jgi:hypothetical protein
LLFALAAAFFFVIKDHEFLMSLSILSSFVLALMMGAA